MTAVDMEGLSLAEAQSRLFELFHENVLSSGEIVTAAVKAVLNDQTSTPEFVKANFSGLLDEISDQAYRLFLNSQADAWSKTIKVFVPDTVSQYPDQNDTATFLSNHFQEFDRFFLSLAQSRKARAGEGFQTIIKTLFRQLNYPFSEQPVIDGKPDFVLPNETHFKNNPIDCIIFTVKRTIRERWRQIVTEGTRGLGFYLATIDRKISPASLIEMGRNRIYLVVPKKAKQIVVQYTSSSNVIDFETFFSDYLDPALNRWRKAGVA